jgi:hypothetical protein
MRQGMQRPRFRACTLAVGDSASDIKVFSFNLDDGVLTPRPQNGNHFN